MQFQSRMREKKNFLYNEQQELKQVSNKEDKTSIGILWFHSH